MNDYRKDPKQAAISSLLFSTIIALVITFSFYYISKTPVICGLEKTYKDDINTLTHLDWLPKVKRARPTSSIKLVKFEHDGSSVLIHFTYKDREDTDEFVKNIYQLTRQKIIITRPNKKHKRSYCGKIEVSR